MSGQGRLVLVTGVSGYLGSHVVARLVQEGFRVRGTVRTPRLPASKKAFAVYGDAVEIIVMDDLIGGSYPDAFKGVDAVIHVAAPLAGRAANAKEAIDVAVEGSLNIFQQAEKAGIRKFSFTSSIVSYSDSWFRGDFKPLHIDDFLSVPKDDILSGKVTDPMIIYVAEKVLSEQAVWEFVDQHPHIEMTTINPPFFYGPFAPGYTAPFESPIISTANLSTMVLFYGILFPDIPKNARPFSPLGVDIRDVARALVAAIDSPPASKVGRKRILVSGEWVHPSQIIAWIEEDRPEVAKRLNQDVKNFAAGIKPVTDNSGLKEILGLEVTPWRKTIIDALDALLEHEKYWKEHGLTPAYA